MVAERTQLRLPLFTQGTTPRVHVTRHVFRKTCISLLRLALFLQALVLIAQWRPETRFLIDISESLTEQWPSIEMFVDVGTYITQVIWKRTVRLQEYAFSGALPERQRDFSKHHDPEELRGRPWNSPSQINGPTSSTSAPEDPADNDHPGIGQRIPMATRISLV